MTQRITSLLNNTDTSLTGIYGIGALTAAEILAEVGDPARLATKDRFAMAISRPGTEGRAYYQRCLDRGKNKREVIRSLKRRISDRVWKCLQDDLKQQILPSS